MDCFTYYYCFIIERQNISFLALSCRPPIAMIKICLGFMFQHTEKMTKTTSNLFLLSMFDLWVFLSDIKYCISSVATSG